MITKEDVLLLLTELRDGGVDCKEQIKQQILAKEPQIEILKFINDNRELDLTNFYKKLRKSYNNKKSKLYINIVKETEEIKDVLTTLSALLTQIILYAKNVDNMVMFYQHSRASEITLVLNNYFKTYDLTNCIKLMKIIKADIKVCESFYRDAEKL